MENFNSITFAGAVGVGAGDGVAAGLGVGVGVGDGVAAGLGAGVGVGDGVAAGLDAGVGAGAGVVQATANRPTIHNTATARCNIFLFILSSFVS